MISSVLVVCVGNVCRSPLGERILAAAAPHLQVTSAGVGALVGAGADAMMSEVAAANGVSLAGHIARGFDAMDAAEKDLILVMAPEHKRDIISFGAHLRGRIMLFGQWTTGAGIPDPYRKPRSMHIHVFKQIDAAAHAWAQRLNNQ